MSVGVAACGAVKRAKYHDESTKVSMVSVSRRAGPPHAGHATCAHVGCRSSGLPGLSNVASSGSRTGRFSRRSGTMPQAAQWITGIGQPQKRCRLRPQSRSRYLVTPCPTPSASQKAMAAATAASPVISRSPATGRRNSTVSPLGGT